MEINRIFQKLFLHKFLCKYFLYKFTVPYAANTSKLANPFIFAYFGKLQTFWMACGSYNLINSFGLRFTAFVRNNQTVKDHVPKAASSTAFLVLQTT